MLGMHFRQRGMFALVAALVLGLWPLAVAEASEAAPRTGLVPQDLDFDLDVDLDDFGIFATCYNGANSPPAPGCPVGPLADFDHDNDVDLDDFSTLAACYNGANNPPSETCPGKQDPGPRCDNCHAVVETFNECHHWANDPNGAACSTTCCIQNDVDTATCDFHENRTGQPNCNTNDVAGPSFVQRIRKQDCPGGAVSWTERHRFYFGCGTDCSEKERILVSCVTATCNGTLVRGPFDRGNKLACGCP